MRVSDSHHEQVPHVVEPDIELPDEVRDAIAIASSPLRVAILRVLATEPTTTLQLVDELDITSRGTLPRNLAALEAAGAITGSPDPGQRRGRTVTWSINRTRVRHLGRIITDYALGK
jgi:DNA-binding transcriptional ArsR family regulator